MFKESKLEQATENVLAEPGEFEAMLQKNTEELLASHNEEDVKKKIQSIVKKIERFMQVSDKSVVVKTDPNLDTFCCGIVPSKVVQSDGTVIVDDNPKKKSYLIGVPFSMVAGQAPITFLKGEVRHELGHADYTDFDRIDRFRKLEKQMGFSPGDLTSLDNCIEDPRIERIIGGARHDAERLQLFEKNRLFIIPNIAHGLGRGGISLRDQFIFGVKLKGLWDINEKELGGVEKPWSQDNFDPLVKEALAELDPVLSQIMGSGVKPSLKNNAKVEALIVEKIVPIYKKICDESRERQEQDQAQNQKQSGESGDQKEKPQDGQGESPDGEIDPEGVPLDPEHLEDWPDEMKKIFQKMVDEHEEDLEEQAKKKKVESEQNQELKKRREKEEHEKMKYSDGFEEAEARKEYSRIATEVRPQTVRLKKIFEKIIPKTIEPSHVYGQVGTTMSVRRLIQKKGSAHENPMKKKRKPEQNALLLQVLVDVSGSMYNDERIENAVKACVALIEASKNSNLEIEILANDGECISDGQEARDKYGVIRFGQKIDGKAKTRVLSMQDINKFGGGNKDGKAIRAGHGSIRKRAQRAKQQYNRIASLMLYISDAKTESEDTKEAVEECRNMGKVSFEGTAITNDTEIVNAVRGQFGKNSLVPEGLDEFPSVIERILRRYVMRLKSNN